jgi:hypothetical protein
MAAHKGYHTHHYHDLIMVTSEFNTPTYLLGFPPFAHSLIVFFHPVISAWIHPHPWLIVNILS